MTIARSKRLVSKGALALAATTVGLLTCLSDARASSHREALAILNDPCVDNTDVYAWVSPGTHDKLYLIAGYNGLHEPGQGNQQTRLCDDVLYEFHITRGVGPLEDAVTYQIEFDSTPPTPVDPSKLDLPVGGGKELLIQIGGVKQTYKVTKIEAGKKPVVIAENVPVAPPNIGPFTDRIAYGLKPAYDPKSPPKPNEGLYNQAFADTFIAPMGGSTAPEGRAWAGTRDDGFYLDEKAIFDIINLQPKGVGKDVFAGFNLNVIALEVPTKAVTGTNALPAHDGTPGDDTLIGVWASASRRKHRILRHDGNDTNYGPWVQVGREGLPLINAAVIGVQDQTKFLRTKPITGFDNFGVYFTTPILVRDAEFLGIYERNNLSDKVPALKSNRSDIVATINIDTIPSPENKTVVHHVPVGSKTTGDVLRVDLAVDSGFPNGRPIPGGCKGVTPCNQEQADVSDVLLTVIVGGGTVPIGDGVDYNDKNFLPDFPFLPLPHQGLTGGHGGITP